MREGRYIVTNSDLYYEVHKVHYISKEKNYVKLKASIFYKSNGKLCKWLCPYGAKNFKLLWDVVKHWERV